MSDPIKGGLSFPSIQNLNIKDLKEASESPRHVAPHIDRSKVDPKIVKAAEGLESVFLEYMMKVMRQTVPKNELDLESPATEIYRGMLDSEYAQKAVHSGPQGGGIGLADQVIAYLLSQGYNLNKEKP